MNKLRKRWEVGKDAGRLNCWAHQSSSGCVLPRQYRISAVQPLVPSTGCSWLRICVTASLLVSIHFLGRKISCFQPCLVFSTHPQLVSHQELAGLANTHCFQSKKFTQSQMRVRATPILILVYCKYLYRGNHPTQRDAIKKIGQRNQPKISRDCWKFGNHVFNLSPSLSL